MQRCQQGGRGQVGPHPHAAHDPRQLAGTGDDDRPAGLIGERKREVTFERPDRQGFRVRRGAPGAAGREAIRSDGFKN